MIAATFLPIVIMSPQLNQESHYGELAKLGKKNDGLVTCSLANTDIPAHYKALSENSIVGPRASVFSPGKDGEAGDVGFIVDTAGCG
ncbi:MAG: hypothetical protein IIC50_02105 [Planctomycetes bacterium]|nr:hypothetical protein [Planctomycetota bacterium]